MRAAALICCFGCVAASAMAQAPSAAPRGSDFATTIQPPGTAPAVAGLSTGLVVAIDVPRKRITLRHEGVRNLALPATETSFESADPALLRRLKVGDKLLFAAERAPGGVLVITRSQLSE